MFEAVGKSFPYRLVLRGMLVILLGLLLTVVLLHFSFHQERGHSYAESYRVFSSLGEELLQKSIFIYLSSSFLIVLGVALISLIYSHRVAGPLYRLEAFSRKIASGDLSQTVRLRQSDVIHPMADDLNSVVSSLRRTVVRMDSEIKELKELSAGLKAAPERDLMQTLESVSEKTEEIKEMLLSNIRL